MNLTRASNKLSALELKLTYEAYLIEILWYRAMQLQGEWIIDRHTHSSYEFHIIAKGQCQVILDEETYIAKEGMFYMTPPGVYHEQRSHGDGEFIEYSLNLECVQKDTSSHESLKHSESRESEVVMSILEKADARAYTMKGTPIQALFEKVFQEADEEALGYHTVIGNLTMELIIHLARVLKGEQELSEIKIPKKLKADEQRYILINRYIQDNLSNRLKVSTIARHLHLSEKQVNRIVRNHRGISVKSLILKRKLEEAKRLLKETDFSQKEIAHLLGFTSAYYFNQFFKREEGDTPGSFRENIGNVRKY